MFRKGGKTKSCENCIKNKKRCGMTEETSRRVRRKKTEEKGKEPEKATEKTTDDGGENGQMEGASERAEKTVEAERTERTEGTAEMGMTRVSGMEARILRRLDKMEKVLSEISGEVSELYDMLDPGWVWELEMAQSEMSEQESEGLEMDWKKELEELEAENEEAGMETEE